MLPMFGKTIEDIASRLNPQHLANVHRLDQQTATMRVNNLAGYGFSSEVNQGYASCIQAYAVLHAHEIGYKAYDALDHAANLLLRNCAEEERYEGSLRTNRHEAASRYAKEKVAELKKTGDVLILSGNAGHATVVRLRSGPEGNILCSTYNAGEEGRPYSDNPSRLAVERHQWLQNPKQVRDFISNNALKRVAGSGSVEHGRLMREIEDALHAPHAERQGAGQGWANCTARSTREFLTGICGEAGRPELADGIRSLAVGGIEDNAYHPQQLYHNLAASLDALKNTSPEQYIAGAIDRNGGLPTEYARDGTVRQVQGAYSVSRQGRQVTLEVRPPASGDMAGQIERRMRGILGAHGAADLVSGEGNKVSWDESASHIAAGCIQDYIGGRRMDSLRAEVFRQTNGVHYDVMWSEQGITAVDRRDGRHHACPREQVDNILVNKAPKEFLACLMDEGAQFKQTPGRGVHMDTMDSVGLNGLQRAIVGAMRQTGHLEDKACLGGKPRCLSIATGKDPYLSSFAMFRQNRSSLGAHDCQTLRLPEFLRQPQQDNPGRGR